MSRERIKIKRRNPIAADLASPKYRARVKPSLKKPRRPKHARKQEDFS